MPILPLVDLLILLGSGSLLIGFLLKAVALASVYRPTLFGLSSLDLALITLVCFGMALTLVARSWLKLNEPGMLALRSRMRLEEAHRQVQQAEAAQRTGESAETPEPAPTPISAADAS